MKTTDPRDPLDQQIDALLKARPLQPSDDFARHVLEACEKETPSPSNEKSERSNVLRFALPLAAAIAIALVSATILRQETTQPDAGFTKATTISQASENDIAPATVNEIDAQEIFLIEDSLTSLALADETTELGNGKLLATFDALLYEIQS